MNRAYMEQERRELIGFVRLLVGYGCAGVDLDPEDTSLCGKCGPCEARQWLTDRDLLKPRPRPLLTKRESEVLGELPADDWYRPIDIGGSDGSDHSAVLNRLVTKGYAEMRRRHTLANMLRSSRGSYVYRRLQ